MYIHIGGEYTISSHLIIGLFDIDAVTNDPTDSSTMDFLRRAEAEHRLESITFEIPRSIVVTLERIYLSPVSTATLRARLDNPASAFSS